MAARWAQRACALAPGDEGWLRRAMALLDEGGDTGGALRLYETTARRLATEFDATPSAETEALAARIRDGGRKPMAASASSRRRRHRPVPLAPRSRGRDAAPASCGDAARRVAAWMAALGAVAVLAVVCVPRGAKHQRSVTPRPRVLVAVFDNRTGDATLQSLGRMTQDWLAQGILRTQLGGRGGSARGVRAGPAADVPVDPVTLAHRTGAAMVISGSYYRTGDTLFVQAAVTDAHTGRIVRVVGPILSSVRAPVAALDELRSRVMTALAAAVDVHALQDLGRGEPPPFDAYRDYVDGWDAYWHGDGPRAKALFLRAARRDTGVHQRRPLRRVCRRQLQ